MDKIEELEEMALELQDKTLKLAQEIAELKKGQNSGEWKPEKGETYYYMDFCGEPTFTDNVGWGSDKWILKTMPVFQTREECQKYCDYRKALIDKSYKFSCEEWENTSILKFTIVYSYDDKEFNIVPWYYNRYMGAFTFKTREDAQFMIDNYSEEMLKWGLN